MFCFPKALVILSCFILVSAVKTAASEPRKSDLVDPTHVDLTTVSSHTPLNGKAISTSLIHLGGTSEYRGQPKKWRQSTLEMRRSIRSRERDDAVSIQDDTSNQFYDSTPTNATTREVKLSHSNLHRRFDFNDVCRFIRRCLAPNIGDHHIIVAAFQISIILGPLIEALSNLAGNAVDLWAFLGVPIVLTIVSAATSTFLTRIIVWTEGNIKGSSCSDEYSDAEIIRNIISTVMAGRPYSTVKTSIQNRDRSANITVQIIPDGQTVGEACGAPPREPILAGELSPSTAAAATSSQALIATPTMTPELRSFANLKRLVFTRFDLLANDTFKYALQCLRFLFETIIAVAEDLAREWALNKERNTWLRTAPFSLDIASSDGSELSANHFSNFAETMLGAMASGLIGTFAGYMFLDMPFVLYFDLHIQTGSSQSKVGKA